MARVIDLNADLGEYDDAESIARDIALMQHISSCNIACGGHAGTPALMRTMLSAAQQAGIAAGAHPSYPDRTNFGRQTMAIAPDELCAALVGQVTQLRDIAGSLNIQLTHIKPHGALYNDLADSQELADSVAQTVHSYFPDMKLVGLADGVMRNSANDVGAQYIGEALIDRSYTPQKRLTPRSQPGAVLDNDPARIAQALSITLHSEASAADGTAININAQSLCIHSDSKGALETARQVRAALEDAGVTVASI